MAQAEPLATSHGQCIQTISSAPVFDLSFKIVSGVGTGLFSLNAVPWKNLTCVATRVHIECNDVDRVIRVTIGSSGVAHVFDGGREVIALPCK